MIDIYIGIMLMVGLAIVLAGVGLWIGRRGPRGVVIAMMIGVIAFMFLFSLVLLDSGWMVRVLPVSNVIVVGNWQLPAVGLLVGLAWGVLPRAVWRRLLVVVPLVAIGVWRTIGPLMGEVPRVTQAQWSEGVHLQSAFSTCGAAAAATLLRTAGIDATEAEMAELCLTREGGTTFHGLYRGLKLKTEGTPWRVEVVRGTVAELAADSGAGAGAALLNVGLPRWGVPWGAAGSEPVDPRYEREWGWMPGYMHSIVLFGFEPQEMIEVGDPAMGRERWSVSSLHTLWRGQGLRLVRRARR